MERTINMRVIHVVTSIAEEFAGPSYSVPSLCSALKKNGCDVTLFTLEPAVFRDYDFPVVYFKRDLTFGSVISKILGISSSMHKELESVAGDVDIIHSHMLWKAVNIYPGLVAKKNNVPFLISPRGTLSTWALNHAAWKKKLSLIFGQKKALDAVSVFHATAESEKSEIESFGYNKTACTVIPNGIDIPKLYEIKKKKRLVFVSRIHEKKGVGLLIKVWSSLQLLFPSWSLSIVGPLNNEYAKSMMALSKELKCVNIEFTGELYGAEKDKYLQESSLFVLPTHSENFGMVVAEALANSIPVICSKGAPWAGLEQYECGWWINNDYESLYKQLETSMSLDLSELNNMGMKGREWMSTEYSWDAIAKRMIQSYTLLLKN